MLSHIWFDVDNTLYQMVGTRLEARIFNEMYNAVLDKRAALNPHFQAQLAELEKKESNSLSAVGKILAALEKIYDGLYYGDESKGIEGLDSHSRVFAALGLERKLANDAYNKPNIPEYVGREPRLVGLFAYFDIIDMPYSLYSNNHASTVDPVLEKLGLKPTNFKIRIYGDAYPKGMGDEGFGVIIAQSNVAPPNILFVGDRPSVDLRPARQQGMKTALVTWPERNQSDQDMRIRIPYSKKTYADYTLENGPYGIKEIVDSLLRPGRNTGL